MLLLRRSSAGTCWICGSKSSPTREHKFKASDLRRHFGTTTVHVRAGEGTDVRVAQGPSSSHLKYESTICERCNSATTQESDRAYDRLIEYIERNGSDIAAITNAFNQPEFQVGAQLYIPVFRYFAKLLGCHLADIRAPIPIHLSRFVAKKNAKNCIWLDVRRDLEYQRISTEFSISDLRYAAHGGLVVITKAPKLLPVRLHTTMTVGPVQFVFFYVFTIFEISEMRLCYPEFVRWCEQQAQLATENPISPSHLQKLGLQ